MSSAQRVERALRIAGLSQRAAAAATGISQPTICRIVSGDRRAKVPELLAIAAATGLPPAELLGTSTVAGRAESAARATGGSPMEEMRGRLLQLLELDAYLEDQGVTAST
jgi:transcriptional regulator with XRE-family HTH domain